MELTQFPATSCQVFRIALGARARGGWMWGGTESVMYVGTGKGKLSKRVMKGSPKSVINRRMYNCLCIYWDGVGGVPGRRLIPLRADVETLVPSFRLAPLCSAFRFNITPLEFLITSPPTL